MSEYTIEELMLKVAEGESLAGSDLEGLISVSYTHLTLPTNREV